MKTINGVEMDLTGMFLNGVEVLAFVGKTKKGHKVYKVRSKTKEIYNEAAINLISSRRH
jgi:hypothetical protein